MNFDEMFVRMAHLVAQKSKDPSTKVGCVITSPDYVVRSTGFNGFARKVREDIESRWERPEKYLWICHAEANAVFNAAREGVSLKGSTAYLNFEPCPCGECANALIQSGVIKIIGPERPFVGKGNGVNYHTSVGSLKLYEAMIETIIIKSPEGLFDET